MFLKIIKLIFLSVFCIYSYAQKKYWVEAHPRDISTLLELSSEVCSTLLSRCSYQLNQQQKSMLHDHDIAYFPVLFLNPLDVKQDKLQLGFAMEQIGAIHLITAGLSGKRVKIGIIDGGFYKANELLSLSHIFDNQRVAEYIDYITPEVDAYKGSISLDDIHGTEVWQNIAGFNPDKNLQFGLAKDAIFYLARTDHGAYEKRIEEDLLIKAMEHMINQGVKLINISLGYTNGYSKPSENYFPNQMNGKTSMMARAVDSAYFRKNTLVVCAGGNDGNNPKWRVVNTPGDALGAFTVGASKINIWEQMNYSSVGSPLLEYMKPNITCFATQGTSFSTPIITGLAAAIWEYDSTFTAKQVRQIIERSGNYYPYGNDRVGYGVPNGMKIMSILKGESFKNVPYLIRSKSNKVSIDQEIKNNYVVLYHKRDDFHVIDQEIIRPKKNKIKLKRLSETVKRTTILIDNTVIEIVWE